MIGIIPALQGFQLYYHLYVWLIMLLELKREYMEYTLLVSAF